MNQVEVQLTHKRPVHGGLNLAELESLGLDPGEIIDFSASINPLGPSLQALDAIESPELAAYPDPDCTELRRAISGLSGVDVEGIVVGNGSTELIHLLARALLGPDDKAVIFSPTFGEYAAACRLQGVEPIAISPIAQTFEWDLNDAADMISGVSPGLVFLCNPNNPTGVYLDESEVLSIAEAVDDKGLLVLDEAYLPFVSDSWDSLGLLSIGNVALLRSMTKDHALTGLRLGYLLASVEVAALVRKFQYSWSVNTLAQSAGLAALGDSDHAAMGRAVVNQGKEYLRDAASSLGLECPPSAANFLLMKVGQADKVRRELLIQHGVCVRDCTSFGLPSYIRVGVRTMDENQVLVNALSSVLSARRS